MPETLIVIFLLFFAVLAFGWFYWQRAKSRSVEVTTKVDSQAPDTTAHGDPPA